MQFAGPIAKELPTAFRRSISMDSWLFFEIALLSVASIPLSAQMSNVPGQDRGPIQSFDPFFAREMYREVPNHPPSDDSGLPENQRLRISRPEFHLNDTDNNTCSNNTSESDAEMQ